MIRIDFFLISSLAEYAAGVSLESRVYINPGLNGTVIIDSRFDAFNRGHFSILGDKTP